MPNATTLTSMLKWLLYPVYFTQLFTGAKSFEANLSISKPPDYARRQHKCRRPRAREENPRLSS